MDNQITQLLNQVIHEINQNHSDLPIRIQLPPIPPTMFFNSMIHRNNIMSNILNQSFNEQEIKEKPMDKNFKENLKQFNISENEIKKELSCAICLEKFKLNEKIIQLPCKDIKHSFHIGDSENCDGILPWLKDNNTCPVCRSEFPFYEKEKYTNENNNETNTIEPYGSDLNETNPIEPYNGHINISDLLNNELNNNEQIQMPESLISTNNTELTEEQRNLLNTPNHEIEPYDPNPIQNSITNETNTNEINMNEINTNESNSNNIIHTIMDSIIDNVVSNNTPNNEQNINESNNREINRIQLSPNIFRNILIESFNNRNHNRNHEEEELQRAILNSLENQ